MAITTLAGAVAGELQPVTFCKINANSAGTWLDTWTNAVGAGTNVTASANGSTYSSTSAQVVGQLRHQDPATGNSYISTLKGRMSPVGNNSAVCALLVDRLWQGGTYPATTTASQAITTPTFPARDINGSTNGDGVLIYATATTNFTASTTITITYTNQAGTGSRTGTCTLTSTTAGFSDFLSLQSGDTGVRSIQAVAVGAAQAAGAYILVAVRPLLLHTLDTGCKTSCDDVITMGMPRLYDGSVPYILIRGQASNVRFVGTYVETTG